MDKLSNRDLPDGWLGYCEYPCNGPVMGRSRTYLAFSHAAYWIWMRLPNWLAMSKAAAPLLARAGDIAFACSCHDKNHNARCGYETI